MDEAGVRWKVQGEGGGGSADCFLTQKRVWKHEDYGEDLWVRLPEVYFDAVEANLVFKLHAKVHGVDVVVLVVSYGFEDVCAAVLEWEAHEEAVGQ